MIILEAILGNIEIDIEEIKNLNNGDTIGLKENSFCVKENDVILEKQKIHICVSSNNRISLKPVRNIKINLDIENITEKEEEITKIDNSVYFFNNKNIDKNNITNFMYSYEPEVLSIILEKKGIFLSAFILANLSNKDFVFNIFNNFKDEKFKSEIIYKISDLKEIKIDYLILVFDLLKKELNKIKVNDKIDGKQMSIELFKRYKNTISEIELNNTLKEIEIRDSKLFNELKLN